MATIIANDGQTIDPADYPKTARGPIDQKKASKDYMMTCSREDFLDVCINSLGMSEKDALALYFKKRGTQESEVPASE